MGNHGYEGTIRVSPWTKLSESVRARLRIDEKKNKNRGSHEFSIGVIVYQDNVDWNTNILEQYNDIQTAVSYRSVPPSKTECSACSMTSMAFSPIPSSAPSLSCTPVLSWRWA